MEIALVVVFLGIFGIGVNHKATDCRPLTEVQKAKYQMQDALDSYREGRAMSGVSFSTKSGKGGIKISKGMYRTSDKILYVGD